MRWSNYLFLLLFCACSKGTIQHIDRNAFYFQVHDLDAEALDKHYSSFLGRVNLKREKFAFDFKKDASDETLRSARKFLYRTLTDTLFQYWYDTDWDYYGTSEKPRQGNIACGYFVTTTLRHAGFKIDRVRLAQQAASVIINTICNPNSVKIFTNGNLSGFSKHVRSLDDGLYIIGLDNHVGFIQKKDTSSFLIHSSGWPERKVKCEPALTSTPIVRNNFFMIGNVLSNKELVKKWIRGEEIPIAE
jgi:hypothetical protein